MAKEKLYYIKNGYVGNATLWWGINSNGYVSDLEKAGKYNHKEAMDICRARVGDTAYLCSRIDANKAAHKVIIDAQYIGKPNIIGRKYKKLKEKKDTRTEAS